MYHGNEVMMAKCKRLIFQETSSDWKFKKLRACLHGGGGLQIGEVTCGGSPYLSCKRDQIKMRDFMDRRFTPPKRITSPSWGPPPPCKQALNVIIKNQTHNNFPRSALRQIIEMTPKCSRNPSLVTRGPT